jgi:hypothetical protein
MTARSTICRQWAHAPGAIVALLLAACGGGGNGGSPPPRPPPTSTYTVGATVAFRRLAMCPAGDPALPPGPTPLWSQRLDRFRR